MQAGRSKLDVGTRVRITGCDEEVLNGLVGTVTNPFYDGCTDDGWVGVWLDSGQHYQPELRWAARVNVHQDEVELLKSC